MTIARSDAAHIFAHAAGGPYQRNEVIDLIRRLEEIDAELGGVGPRTLQSAMADALAELASGGL